MRELGHSGPRVIALADSAPRHSDPTRCLAIAVIAAAGGTMLAALVALAGGGFVAALLAYTVGGSLVAAGVAVWLLVREAAAPLRLGAVLPRRARRLRRLPS